MLATMKPSHILSGHILSGRLLTGMLMFVLLAFSLPHAQAQNAGPFAVYTILPCRVLDTRIATAPDITGKMQPGDTIVIFVTGDLILQGASEDNCNIPITARGVFLNIAAVAPEDSGHLVVYSSEAMQPSVSTINYHESIPALANGIMTEICDNSTGGCRRGELAITNVSNAGAVHVIIDVTGYLM